MSGCEGKGWTAATCQNGRSLDGDRGKRTDGNSNSEIFGGQPTHTILGYHLISLRILDGLLMK